MVKCHIPSLSYQCTDEYWYSAFTPNGSNGVAVTNMISVFWCIIFYRSLTLITGYKKWKMLAAKFIYIYSMFISYSYSICPIYTSLMQLWNVNTDCNFIGCKSDSVSLSIIIWDAFVYPAKEMRWQLWCELNELKTVSRTEFGEPCKPNVIGFEFGFKIVIWYESRTVWQLRRLHRLSLGMDN